MDVTNYIGSQVPDDFNIGHFCVIGKNVEIGKNVRIDNYVVIDDNVTIGSGVWIGSWVHLRPGVKIGNNSEVRDWCYLSIDVEIGVNTKVCQKANVGGWIKIGSNCFIAPGFSSANTRNMNHGREIDDYKYDVPEIKDNVRIGTNVTILPGVVIAEESFIGGGAVVVKSTESCGVYVGNPAKKINNIREKDKVKNAKKNAKKNG